jgi:MoxR-like ATPase
VGQSHIAFRDDWRTHGPLRSRDIEDVVRGFERLGYVLDRALATAIYLLIKLGKPLLIEGHAGVGKTEVAKVPRACSVPN